MVPAPAFAADAPATVQGKWAVGMIQSEKKAFAYCLARAPYNNGLQLAIALSPKKEVNVGVMVPDAGYNAGDKYPMTVTVDGSFKRSHPGVAAQPELIMVPLGPDKEILAMLKNGKVLSIEGPQDIARFSLKGSGKALEGLQQCVDVGTGKIKPPAMPAPGAGPQAAAAPSGKALKFPPSLLKILKDSGLKNLQLVSIPDPSKAPVDFAWRTQGVLGGLRERPVPPDLTLDKMAGIIEEGYKKQCTSGKFDSKMGAAEALPGVTLRKADFSCVLGDKTAHVSLLLYITDTHLFSMFMHEAQGANKEGAMHARDAITAQIRKLAKEQHTEAPPTAPASPGPAVPPTAVPAPAAAPSPWADPNAGKPAAPAPANPPASSTTPQPLPTAPPPAASSSSATPPPAVTDKKQ